jgi:two-component system cell cycle response regulator DivK
VIPQGYRVPEYPTPTRRRVLVVEDNKLNMKLFCDLLESRGHEVVQSRDGLDALKLTRQLRPDLIIMDIQLPEVSGVEVTKWIKNEEPLKAIPIIAVTAFAMRGDQEMILQSGCDSYISKPIDNKNFIAVVERFLNQSVTK